MTVNSCVPYHAVAESELGSEGSWYNGTETEDARLGGYSFVGTRQSEMKRGKGQERVDLLGGNWVTEIDGGVGLRIIPP